MTLENTPGIHDSSERRPVVASLRTALVRARWAIFWERLWPSLAGIATVLGLFLAASWFGLWLMLPAIGRAIGLSLFVLLALASLYPLIRLRWPAEAEALRRLDRNSGILHRPATTVSDEMATAASDPVSAALWRAHVERSLAAAKRLRAGVPRPLLALRDPLALRALVGLLAVATFFAAGEDRFRRVVAAFDWQGVVPVANFRVDAWVSPPTYTGRPPVILQGLRPGEVVQKTAATTVPAGSTLVVRATGDVHPEVTVTGGLAESKGEAPTAAAAGTQERRFVISQAGSATLRGLSIGDVTWAFAATPDRAPTIELTKEPEPQLRGTLKLTYKMEDDYGVSEARAAFVLKDKPANQPRPLYQAPDFALTLPQSRTRQGTGEMTKDLVEHPWAGTDVVMTLTAKDEAGNEGHSAPLEFRLPERPFNNPMARALIEQRRILALDADSRDEVLMSLDALAMAPERFDMESSVYLGLRSIFWNLSRTKSDDDLRDVVARLWAMAVMIEDGNISDAEQALRAAQDALREALERGASDQELKQLMDQLRAAMDKFLQALAEQQQRNPQQLARPLDPNARVLRPQDLKNMLDRLEQMARSGAKDAARQMLSQLQQMLDNLQMAQPGQQQQGDSDDDMMQALDQLGDMIRRQQQLRDRTYQQGQDQRRDRQRGQRGDQNGMNELRQNQQALRDQLNKLLEQLRQRGMGQQGQDGQQGQQGQQGQGGQPGGDMGQQLGRAGEAMGDAEGSLGEGNADGAVDSQGRALDALRRGAQSLAQQMQQQMGQGEGPGQPGRFGQPRAERDTDPLGRPLRGRDYGDDSSVKVPGEIDVQRARRILEELRRRFGEDFRPQLELDYIERLLKDF